MLAFRKNKNKSFGHIKCEKVNPKREKEKSI